MDDKPTRRKRGRPPLSDAEKQLRAERRKELAAQKKLVVQAQTAAIKRDMTRQRKIKEYETYHRQNKAAQLQERREAQAINDSVTVNDAGEDTTNRKYLQHSLEVARFALVDWYNVNSVRDRCTLYFATCLRNDMKPSYAGLALAFGVSRGEFDRIRTGQRRAYIPKACLAEIDKAIGIINAQMEDYMLGSKINPVSGIFLLKNNHGYVDAKELTVAPKEEKEISAEKLIEEANALPDGDD